jgi:hypothetical protein
MNSCQPVFTTVPYFSNGKKDKLKSNKSPLTPQGDKGQLELRRSLKETGKKVSPFRYRKTSVSTGPKVAAVP